MPNLPISTHKVGKSSLSAKEKLNEVKNEARRVKDAIISMAYNMVPSGMEVVRQSMDAIVSSATSLVDAQFKATTGMTMPEAKYKLDEGIQKFNRYKELSSSSQDKSIDNKKNNDKAADKKQKAEKKAKVKKDLIDWLKKQSDTVYNAFLLVMAKELVSDVKTVTAQMMDGGAQLIQENVENLSSLKKFFGGGSKKYKKDSPKEDVNLTIDYTNEDDGTAKAMLSELAKSAKTEEGEEDLAATELSEKAIAPTTGQIFAIIGTLLTLLGLLFTLVNNYNTNKNGIKTDESKHSAETARANAEKLGLTATVPMNPVVNTVDISNTDDKKKKRAEIEERKNNLNADALGNGNGNTNSSNSNGNSNVNGLTPSLDSQGMASATVSDNSNGNNGNPYDSASVGDNLSSSNKNGDSTSLDNNGSQGNSSSISSEDSPNALNMKEGLDRLLDDTEIKTGNKSWNPKNTQEADMEFMKFLMPVEDLDSMDVPEEFTKYDGPFVASPSDDKMYVAPKDSDNDQILFSEIDRVAMAVDEVQDKCKYKPEFPLYSLSTKTNGGIMKNLEFSGDTKKEVIEAVLDINGGVRL